MNLIFGAFENERLSQKFSYAMPSEYVSFFKSSYGNASIFLQSYSKESQAQSIAAIYADQQHQLTIIADARLINRKSLLAEFGFKTATDSQLILTAYLRWGIQCIHHLLGNFAFAIWNPNTQQFFLACDPLGARTLFYGFDKNNRLYFANLIKPLFDLGALPKSLNPPYIAELLTYAYGDHDLTAFSSIKRLPSGHYLIYENNKKITCKRYWFPLEIHQDPLQLPNRKAYYSHFRELYTEVIQDHLSTFNHPIGCHLSGGLDSSSVTAVAATLLQKNNQTLNAFSYVPTPSAVKARTKFHTYDDSNFIESMVNQYSNINLIYIRDEHKELFDYHQTFQDWLDVPMFIPTNASWLIACIESAHQAGIKSILIGQMGNLTLSWVGIKTRSTFYEGQMMNFLRNQFYKLYYGEQIKRPWRGFSAVSDKLISQTKWLSRYRSIKKSENLMVKTNRYRESILNAHNINCSASFDTVSRLLYNVESIDPTADKRILEFCLRTPNDIFNNENGSRLLVRESMHGILPELIRNRVTIGLQASDWYKKIERKKDFIQQQLIAWKNTVIEDYIDLDHLLHQFKKWNYQRVSNSEKRQYCYYNYNYHLKLLLALEMGYFIERHSK